MPGRRDSLTLWRLLLRQRPRDWPIPVGVTAVVAASAHAVVAARATVHGELVRQGRRGTFAMFSYVFGFILARFAGLCLVFVDSSEASTARRSSENIDPAVAATATAVQRVHSMWERRRNSDMQGRIRFADSTLTDPTYQQQVSGLLGATTAARRSSAVPAATNLLSPSAPAPQR